MRLLSVHRRLLHIQYTYLIAFYFRNGLSMQDQRSLPLHKKRYTRDKRLSVFNQIKAPSGIQLTTFSDHLYLWTVKDRHYIHSHKSYRRSKHAVNIAQSEKGRLPVDMEQQSAWSTNRLSHFPLVPRRTPLMVRRILLPTYRQNGYQCSKNNNLLFFPLIDGLSFHITTRTICTLPQHQTQHPY